MIKTTLNLNAEPQTVHSNFNESNILDIPIANSNYDCIVNQIINWGKNREHRYIGVCNVHSTTSAAWTPKLRSALLNSDLNTADGVPLVWTQRLLGHKQASRVYGPTLMLKTLEKACKSNLRIAFYGGHPSRLTLLLSQLRKEFQGIKIVEAISPPFRTLTNEEEGNYARRLIESKADIIWVGLGCPKQEAWMMENSPIIPGVMIGVGAAFDFHAGAVKQAPRQIQTLGLEWAYRLYREPRRLFVRYATTNPLFVIRISLQIIHHKIGNLLGLSRSN